MEAIPRPQDVASIHESQVFAWIMATRYSQSGGLYSDRLSFMHMGKRGRRTELIVQFVMALLAIVKPVATAVVKVSTAINKADL